MKTLTLFQEKCETTLENILKKDGLVLRNRNIAGKHEKYIVAEIPSVCIKIWIYEEEAMFTVVDKSYFYEALDYPDKDLLISKFVEAIISCSKNEVRIDTGSSRISLFKGREL
ncbi:hypothetical protein W03_05690 [Nitrosomonas sp. PY1]|uniref:hypothetical protein n=1 Tax=Nitrosomonas sp. PY1 TaxID=1803906 RepID=UPI001FC881C9|nr:hypothetical protein [Nitrosomonas sp. PY1]GKS68565.1 hypothetical protein W03_05690 [Nitrosomonas sp. PY1]